MDGIITAAAARSFRTEAGGARPSTLAEQAEHPMFDADAFLRRPLLSGVEVVDQWARYNALCRSMNQAWSGTCVNNGVSVIQQQAVLLQGGAPINLSAFYGHLKATGDRTFRIGTSPDWVARQRMTQGCCADPLYPQDYAIANFGGGPIGDDQFPSAAANADALTRKILRYSVVANANPDLDLLDALLDAGMFVTACLGNHCFALGKSKRKTDGIYAGKDSEMFGQDFGAGEGNRFYFADAIKNSAYGLVVAELVQVDGQTPPAPSGNVATIAALKANQAQTEALTNALIAG